MNVERSTQGRSDFDCVEQHMTHKAGVSYLCLSHLFDETCFLCNLNCGFNNETH